MPKSVSDNHYRDSYLHSYEVIVDFLEKVGKKENFYQQGNSDREIGRLIFQIYYYYHYQRQTNLNYDWVIDIEGFYIPIRHHHYDRPIARCLLCKYSQKPRQGKTVNGKRFITISDSGVLMVIGSAFTNNYGFGVRAIEDRLVTFGIPKLINFLTIIPKKCYSIFRNKISHYGKTQRIR